MAASSTSSIGTWPYPFRGFHCCPDGQVGSKGISYLISHIKRVHLASDERKDVLWEAISRDHGLYIDVEETLKAFGQWICVNCMNIHALSHYCHHSDGHVQFTGGVDDKSGHIIVIFKDNFHRP